MDLDVGRKNMLWGVIGLFVWNALGSYLEVRLANPEWRRGTNAVFTEMRYYLNSAHSHGNFFAMLNIIFALLIDRARLRRVTKQIASALCLVGYLTPAVLMIAAWYKAVNPITAVGCTCMNLSLLILAVGVVRMLRTTKA